MLGAMTQTQVQSLVAFLGQHGLTMRTIEGPWDVAEAFASQWRCFTQSPCETQMGQGLYELTAVEMPEPRGGKLVQVHHEHQSMIHAWMMDFLSTISDDAVACDALKLRVARFIDEERVYVWQGEGQRFVAMAAIVRESPNTLSISWVCTPTPYRRQGYAARVVASLSQAQLDARKRANILVDLDSICASYR